MDVETETQETTTETTETVAAQTETVVTPDPLEVAHAALQTERDARIRLEGQVEALRRPAEAAPPKSPAQTIHSHEQIEAGLAKGEINDAQARVLHARTAAHQAATEQAVVARQADTGALVRDTLNAHLTRHADLRNPSSPRFAKVLVEVERLERMGMDGKDLRTQLLAVEAVVGRKESPVDAREWNRLRMPGSSAPTTTLNGAPTSGGSADPLKEVPKSVVADWSRRDNLTDPATRKWYGEYWAGLTPRRRARLAGA